MVLIFEKLEMISKDVVQELIRKFVYAKTDGVWLNH